MSDGDAIILGCVLGGPVIIFLIIRLNVYISEQFQSAAEDKGYTGRQYFWLCFFLGMTGYILVAALKDKKSVQNIEEVKAESDDSSLQVESDSEIEIKKEAENTIVSEQRYLCPNCGADVKYGDEKCSQCMQPFYW